MEATAEIKPKLLDIFRYNLRVNHYIDIFRDNLRVNHYSRKTEEAYTSWVKRYIIFHNKKHPKEMGKQEIEKFLNYLTLEQHVSSSTQNQALQAILYLYKKVIKKEVGWLDNIKGLKRVKHLPVVFSKKEVTKIFEHLSGVPKLIVSLLYGEGLRLSESLNLRIKDIDFDYQQILIRDGKEEKDRHTILPFSIIPELKKHLNEVYKQHKADLLKNNGETILPYALARKYPNAGKEFGLAT